jgi:hypothetical protein
VSKDVIKLNGGVYNDKAWKDKLIFKRTSFFQDSNMVYDILITGLKKDSPFFSWLGSDKPNIQKCSQLKVVLLYADVNTQKNTQYLVSEIEKSGLREMIILDFSHQFKAHQNAQDWNLTKHRVVGFCARNAKKIDISLNLPGFKTQSL